MNKKALGRKLKRYRLKANLTQEALATKIGKGKNYISDLERGIKKPSLDVFVSLAKTLNAIVVEMILLENRIINRKLFGKKVKESRIKIDMTQFELAEKIGVSQNFLGDIERGVKLPSLSKLILLSNALKVSLDYLFSDSLDNYVCETTEVYYTDKQLAILNNIIKTINNNF